MPKHSAQRRALAAKLCLELTSGGVACKDVENARREVEAGEPIGWIAHLEGVKRRQHDRRGWRGRGSDWRTVEHTRAVVFHPGEFFARFHAALACGGAVLKIETLSGAVRRLVEALED